MTLQDKLKPGNLFPGEFEAIELEFCGTSPVALLRLSTSKRDRLLAWLRFPKEDRERAFLEVRAWAGSPIAAALNLLQNPVKQVIKPRLPGRGDATAAAIAAFLEEED